MKYLSLPEQRRARTIAMVKGLGYLKTGPGTIEEHDGHARPVLRIFKECKVTIINYTPISSSSSFETIDLKVDMPFFPQGSRL